MKSTLALFGAFTALNTLIGGLLLWIGFAYDKPNLIPLSREFYLEMHEASYIFLAIALLIDLLIWGYDKWKSKHA